MKKTTLNLLQLLEEVKRLADKSPVYLDEVPAVLKDDFMKFIIGKTIGCADNGRSEVYNMKAYYSKLMNKGFDYPIHFSNKH